MADDLTAAGCSVWRGVRRFFRCWVDVRRVPYAVKQTGSTALMYAAASNHMDIVKYLLSKGAAVDAVNLVRGALELGWVGDPPRSNG